MPSQFQIAKAVDTVQHGGVIAYATEAVYGLGCDPDNHHAIQRILEIKGRNARQGFILIASSFAQVQKYLELLSIEEENAIRDYWPGPTTLILSASETVSSLVTGGRDSIAIRITTHQDTRELCDALGHALISTSANRSGQPPIKHAWQLENQFGELVDYIYPSTLGDSDKPSAIIDARTGNRIR
ncbi:MAG: threonylcarbamoyl-AMP synthase [Gammaproteobacteria bacterium]|nr:threonylcarbamoyl-AMP synthase [Gammaproteobacteria bacterium]NNM14545.1 threonylcarbamoyl-AMP synthase [Gammaproteobacteria bacterium]